MVMVGLKPELGLKIVRSDLQTALRAGTGLQVYGRVPDGVVGECLVVRPARPFADYEQRMGRAYATLWHLEVLALAGRVAEESSQDKLDELISPGSRFMNALWGCRIGGNPVRVLRGTDYGGVTVGATEHLGAAVLVDVLA